MFSVWSERGTTPRRVWSKRSKVRFYSITLMILSMIVGGYGLTLMLTKFWIGFGLGFVSVFLFMASAFVAACSYAGILK